jgi:hypothetical protein
VKQGTIKPRRERGSPEGEASATPLTGEETPRKDGANDEPASRR